MKVLSLFDGMSCGQQALERAGIEVENYFASEIDKNAINVSKTNYPNIIHSIYQHVLGSVQILLCFSNTKPVLYEMCHYAY